jgi:hypothetical protein
MKENCDTHPLRKPPSVLHVSMHPANSDPPPLKTSNESGMDINGKQISSYILSSVMEKYPLQEAWPMKHEKVRVATDEQTDEG